MVNGFQRNGLRGCNSYCYRDFHTLLLVVNNYFLCENAISKVDFLDQVVV